MARRPFFLFWGMYCLLLLYLHAHVRPSLVLTVHPKQWPREHSHIGKDDDGSEGYQSHATSRKILCCADCRFCKQNAAKAQLKMDGTVLGKRIIRVDFAHQDVRSNSVFKTRKTMKDTQITTLSMLKGGQHGRCVACPHIMFVSQAKLQEYEGANCIGWSQIVWAKSCWWIVDFEYPELLVLTVSFLPSSETSITSCSCKCWTSDFVHADKASNESEISVALSTPCSFAKAYAEYKYSLEIIHNLSSIFDLGVYHAVYEEDI